MSGEARELILFELGNVISCVLKQVFQILAVNISLDLIHCLSCRI